MMRGHRQDDGSVLLEMPPDQAWILQSLPDRLRAFLRDPASNRRLAERLFPSAYRDQAKEKEYRRLLGDDLAKRKLECVDGFEETLTRFQMTGEQLQLRLTGEEYEFWLGFLNDFRLMLGVELDIQEDDWGEIPDDDRASDFFILHYLTYIQEELLQLSEFELPNIDPEDVNDGMYGDAAEGDAGDGGIDFSAFEIDIDLDDSDSEPKPFSEDDPSDNSDDPQAGS